MLGNRPEIRALGPLHATGGAKTDFWPVPDVGNDPCALLADHPGAWFVLEPYLGSSWVLRDVTEETSVLAFPQAGFAEHNSTFVVQALSDRSLHRKVVKACRRVLLASEEH